MCLVVDFTRWQKLKYYLRLHPKTKEDIEVYVFRIVEDEKIYSPFAFLHLSWDATNFKDPKLIPWEIGSMRNITKQRDKLLDGKLVASGWFHSIQNRQKLGKYIIKCLSVRPRRLLQLIFSNKLRMYKAIIPRGSAFYCGTTADYDYRSYASKHLKIVEDITEEYRKELDSWAEKYKKG